MNNKSNKPFGYIVIFKNLYQTPKNTTPKEVSEKIFARAGLNFDILMEKYGKIEELFTIVSISGRILYMNPAYEKFVKRSNEKDLMYPGLYMMMKTNSDNIFLKENIRKFLKEKSKEVQFQTDMKLLFGGQILVMISAKRIDSFEGIPLMYSVFVYRK